MKKIMLISIIITFLICVLVVPNFSMADAVIDSGGSGGSSITAGLGDLNSYVGSGGGSGSSTFATRMNKIASVIRVIGIVTSVVGLIIIGIKYMLGSVEEKADYKKTLIPYVIGCFLVFTVSVLPQLIYVFMSNF